MNSATVPISKFATANAAIGFSRFFDPFMLSVDASGVVPVGVRPPPPLRGSSPCEAGQFFMAVRMANKRVVTTLRMVNKTAIMVAAWRTEEALRPAQNLLNSPLNFYCPSFPPDGQATGSSAFGHNESRIFAINAGFLSKKHGWLAEKLFFSHRFFNRHWSL